MAGKRHASYAVVSALLVVSCVARNELRFDGPPTVKIVLTTAEGNLPPQLAPYQVGLDSFLVLSAKRTGSFAAYAHTDTLAAPDFLLRITIDSLSLISEEAQRGRLHVKDSIEDAVKRRQAYFDSTHRPPTEEERTAFSIIRGIAAVSTVFVPIPGIGILVTSGTLRPTLTMRDKNGIAQCMSRPRLVGSAVVIRSADRTVAWQTRIEIEDEYDRLVQSPEQIDMLLRALIGNMRFRYKTPFLGERL